MRTVALLSALGVIAIALFECVPADTRPPPGTLNLTVSPSNAVAGGVMTQDGWSISFDRVLVAIGNAGLGHDCAVYGEAGYDRILDVTRDAGQHLGILHGLGSCDVDFRISPPSTDALLGDGVRDEDKTRLRTPGGDAYVPLGGISLDVAATAVHGPVTKRFHLSFRSRVRYQRCSLDRDAGAPAVTLVENGEQTYDIRIEAEALLRDRVDPDAALWFQPFADADSDGDGEITLDELRAVPIDRVRDGGPYEAGTYDVDDAGLVTRGRSILIATLGDFVYQELAPSFARFRGVGTCAASVRDSPPR
jgi:hypothetical protein